MNSRYLDQERLEHLVSPVDPTIDPQSSHCHSGSSILKDGRFECPLNEKQPYRWDGKQNRSRGTIDMLLDVALLDIFDFYLGNTYEKQAWQTLVHVCRNWRNVVFGSPRRLNLRLVCRDTTPARETLDVWPLLPIIIWAHFSTTLDAGNIIAALERNDRVCKMDIFDVPSSGAEKVLAALQQPFPALTDLRYGFQFQKEITPGYRLWSPGGEMPKVRASFLGGSAPGLQTLWLDGIPFPELPMLLLTATHLNTLDLRNIPYSGYISPEAMVAALSVLTRLKSLQIGFEYPQSYLHRPPPQTRILLPAITLLWFNVSTKYLEDFVARIDAPLLDELTIIFHEQIFDSPRGPQLTQFISCTPKFKAHDEARVEFDEVDVTVGGAVKLGIPRSQSDLPLSSVVQVCIMSFPPALILGVEHLYILSRYWGRHWQNYFEDGEWLELFDLFTAVRCLYMDWGFTQQMADALQEFGERVTEVLPALETLFLEEPLSQSPEPVQDAIGQFVAARQLAGHPIAVSLWKRE